MMYSQLVLDHFEHPRNGGELPARQCRRTAGQSHVWRHAGGEPAAQRRRDVEVCFRAKGCVPTIACASRLTEMVEA